MLWLTLIGVVLFAAGINLWAWYHFWEAGRLADRQRFARAYTHYTQSLWVWRWSDSIHFRAARTARRAGLYAEAERHLAECQRLQGDSSVALGLEHLLLRAQSGDINAVEETLWQYVEKYKPETPLVLEALARGYLRMFRSGAALRCLGMLLGREPDHIEALLMRAGIEEGDNDTREARKDYRRALELDPERDDARLSLAKNLLNNDPVEAHTQFEFLLRRQPENLEVLLGLAQTEQALGELDKARAILEGVLAKDPDNSKALTRLGSLLLPAGKLAEAERLFRKAIAADPTNHDAHFRLYMCLAQQPDREDEAAAEVAVYERVRDDVARLGRIANSEMTRTPNDPKLHSELGVLYLRYGKREVGVRWLYSALKLDPNHQPSHQALYDYFQRTGDMERAEWHRAQLQAGTTKSAPIQP
jgi:tetratricopeptide (TPR) repeat protein